MSKPPQTHAKPTSTNPWDVPAREPTGSATQEEIFSAVGRALTAWERLEEGLASLFLTFALSRSMAAARAYGAIVTHSARIDMLIAAAEFYYLEREGSLSDTRKLLTEIGKLSGRRNDIAHGICKFKSMENTNGYYLEPPWYNTNKRSGLYMTEKYTYNAAQIHSFADAFDVYERKISDFAHSLEL